MTPLTFPQNSLDQFDQSYPESIVKIKHALLGHPLMELPALIDLSAKLPPSETLVRALEQCDDAVLTGVWV